MESDNKVLGKIDKKKCYLNNGKYGHYLNYDGKNYKIPEWYPVDRIDIDIAERLIEYKHKMNELWLGDHKSKNKASKTNTSKTNTSESEEEETPKINKKNK